jgi:hypothetical protein
MYHGGVAASSVPANGSIRTQSRHAVQCFTVSPSSVQTDKNNRILQTTQGFKQRPLGFTISDVGTGTTTRTNASQPPAEVITDLNIQTRPGVVDVSHPSNPGPFSCTTQTLLPGTSPTISSPTLQWLEPNRTHDESPNYQSSTCHSEVTQTSSPSVPDQPPSITQRSGPTSCHRELGGCPYQNFRKGNRTRHEVFECRKRTQGEKKFARWLNSCRICTQPTSYSRWYKLVEHVSECHPEVTPPKPRLGGKRRRRSPSEPGVLSSLSEADHRDAWWAGVRYCS